jgi:preprotein translocase subunit SecD
MAGIRVMVLLLLAGWVGCAHAAVYPPRAGIEFRLGEWQAAPGLHAVRLPDGTRRVYLRHDPVLVARDITSIGVSVSDDGRVAIDFRFTAAGSQRMWHATQKNIGRPMAIVLNGKLISCATLSGVIRDRLQLSADSAAAAQILLDRLASTH